MTQRTIHTFMNSATAASAGGAYPCDFRFDDSGQRRNLYGILSNGASVNVYLTISDPKSGSSVTHLEATISAGSTEYTTATQTFGMVINGPIETISVYKADGTGTATVLGIL